MSSRGLRHLANGCRPYKGKKPLTALRVAKPRGAIYLHCMVNHQPASRPATRNGTERSVRAPMVAIDELPAPVWEVSSGLTGYAEAVERMETIAASIRDGNEPERIWLVEHPALYTAGTSARDDDLVDPDFLPVFKTGRGGEYTYHGPGQRVVYVMLDLRRRREDVRAFVGALEDWIIASLADFNVTGERRNERVGVWVRRPEKQPLADGSPREDKIAAIGIRIRRWVTFHGLSINVEPQLSHFAGIVPCGVTGHGVTSLVDLGLPVTMRDLDNALKRNFTPVFGPLCEG
jgi:lipoyl(octanoyl) transferase